VVRRATLGSATSKKASFDPTTRRRITTPDTNLNFGDPAPVVIIFVSLWQGFLGFRDVELPMEQAERGTSFRLFGLTDPVPNPMGSLRA
jgi:hypothetical protein